MFIALFITFDSELEWCCRKSVQDERCIKVVDYSLVVVAWKLSVISAI